MLISLPGWALSPCIGRVCRVCFERFASRIVQTDNPTRCLSGAIAPRSFISSTKPDSKHQPRSLVSPQRWIWTRLIIAKPWYLGYVGTSGRILENDAAFATFLEMQAYAGGILRRLPARPGRLVARGSTLSYHRHQPLKHYTIAALIRPGTPAPEGGSIQSAFCVLGREAAITMNVIVMSSGY